MRKNRVWLTPVLMATLLTALLTACGGSSVDEAPPPAAQTGDTSLFANASLLSTATTLDTEGVIILDSRGETDYQARHIPGAVSAPATKFTVAGKENVLLTVAELEDVLGEMGITRTSKIVIYDNTTQSEGSGGRLFWMLEYLGCTNVTILNGGWDQWLAQEMPTEDATVSHPSRTVVEFDAVENTAISVNKDQVRALVEAKDPGVVLVDARSLVEYTGPEIYKTLRPGHIPGAINLPYKSCYNSDKTVLNYNDLKLLLEAKGITKEKYVVVYSTVGKRSAFIYFLARLMGYPQVTNYCGSAVEWASLDASVYEMVEGPDPYPAP